MSSFLKGASEDMAGAVEPIEKILTKGFLYDNDDDEDDETPYDNIENDGYNYGESFGYEVFEAIQENEGLQEIIMMNVAPSADDEITPALSYTITGSSITVPPPAAAASARRAAALAEFGEGDAEDLWGSDADWDSDEDEEEEGWEHHENYENENDDYSKGDGRPLQKVYRTGSRNEMISFSSSSSSSSSQQQQQQQQPSSLSAAEQQHLYSESVTTSSSLPPTAAAPASASSSGKTAFLAPAEPTVRPTVQLLIVDDSLVQRKVTRNKLSGDMGNEVWLVNTAESGERAMQVFESSATSPDVMIVDQNMITAGGEMFGHELVAKIRKNPAFRRTIIIGCTAFAEEAKAKMLDSGCDAVWTKPMPPKEQMYAQIQEIRRSKMLL